MFSSVNLTCFVYLVYLFSVDRQSLFDANLLSFFGESYSQSTETNTNSSKSTGGGAGSKRRASSIDEDSTAGSKEVTGTTKRSGRPSKK